MTWLVDAAPVFRDVSVAVAALVGSYLAWKRLAPASQQATAAETQASLARRSHVVELFDRAVSQLRSEHIEVRLGAIYVLREVASDFPDLANPVFEVLQAFLRESDAEYLAEEPPIDVRAIMELLRSRIRIEK